MTKQIVKTDQAPAAIGPYSQAVAFDRIIFCSGQIALSPAGEPIPDSVIDQTHRVLRNLQAVLQAANAELSDVVKTTVFVRDMGDFNAINAVYAEYFKVDPPARSTVEVSRLPRDVRVEIEAIAIHS